MPVSLSKSSQMTKQKQNKPYFLVFSPASSFIAIVNCEYIFVNRSGCLIVYDIYATFLSINVCGVFVDD